MELEQPGRPYLGDRIGFHERAALLRIPLHVASAENGFLRNVRPDRQASVPCTEEQCDRVRCPQAGAYFSGKEQSEMVKGCLGGDWAT